MCFFLFPDAKCLRYVFVRDALQDIGEGKMLLLAGATGTAFFSTNSAGALRANEFKAGIIIKATKVNGVCDKNPKKLPM
jgi:uridylate kinase